MEIISVNIQKGGCGKTTTVQALAEIFRTKYEKRVLCVDSDAQCNLSIVSGIRPEECENNLYTLLRKESSLQETIQKTKYYDIIPGSVLMASADNDFNKIGKEQFMKEALKNADYDIIFIDTPPALGLMNIMSLTASNKIIIPIECTYLAMMGLNQLYDTIEAVKTYLNTNLEICGIALIKYNARTNLNMAIEAALNETASAFGTKLYESKIRETVKIKEAQSQETALVDWDSKSTAMMDYYSLAEEIFNDLYK